MKKKIINSDVCAIIIFYYADLSIFNELLQLHIKNYSRILIVNNSPKISLKKYINNKVQIFTNKSNIGLASAINLGINEAKSQGFKFVALFDQDSRIDIHFNQNMINSIKSYNGFVKPAVYSPIYFNEITSEMGFLINFSPLRLVRKKPIDDFIVSKPTYVITSGSYIPIDVLDDVGLMLDKLFIDFIDIDWCFRARNKGYEIINFQHIFIKHTLGDYSKAFMNKKYPIHSPIRMYYYFRNSIYLYKQTYININWKLVDVSRNIFRFVFYMILIKGRISYLRYIVLGIFHGLINKMGPLEE